MYWYLHYVNGELFCQLYRDNLYMVAEHSFISHHWGISHSEPYVNYYLYGNRYKFEWL